MRSAVNRINGVVLGFAALLTAIVAKDATAQWPQFGGPTRDFKVPSKGLADAWPEGGPNMLWKVPLGEGFSPVSVDDGVLFTMYRKNQADQQEYTIALDASTGKTLWEQKHESPTPVDERMFPGPNATPLVLADRVVTIGRNAVMRCYEKTSGKILWQHDLVAEFGAVVPVWGFSSSPIAYRDTVITMVGARRFDSRPRTDPMLEIAAAVPDEDKASLIAVDVATGAVKWKSQNFRTKYTSPILINFAGRDHLIVMPRFGIAGIDPGSGEVLWKRELAKDGGHVMTPLWDGKDLLLYLSTSQGRLMRLIQKNGKVTTEDVWVNKKLNVHVSAPIWADDILVAPKGGQASTHILGADPRTGERLWVERGFAESMLLHADGKVILLDEKGQLVLAKASADGLAVQSSWNLPGWSGPLHTPPTLVGKTLYVRDRKNLLAFDLG